MSRLTLPAGFWRDPDSPDFDMDALVEETKLISRRDCQHQVRALMAAGWVFELPASHDPEPWQWYWRRPPRRKGSKGRRFASTRQAYNALMRDGAPSPS